MADLALPKKLRPPLARVLFSNRSQVLQQRAAAGDPDPDHDPSYGELFVFSAPDIHTVCSPICSQVYNVFTKQELCLPVFSEKVAVIANDPFCLSLDLSPSSLPPWDDAGYFFFFFFYCF